MQHTANIPQSVYAVADGRGQRRYAGIVADVERHGPHAVERRRPARVAATRVDRPRRAFMELLDDRRADAPARAGDDVHRIRVRVAGCRVRGRGEELFDAVRWRLPGQGRGEPYHGVGGELAHGCRLLGVVHSAGLARFASAACRVVLLGTRNDAYGNPPVVELRTGLGQPESVCAACQLILQIACS